MREILAPPGQPDFEAKAKRIAEDYEASCFATVADLKNWIASELYYCWNASARNTERKCEDFCVQKGWMQSIHPRHMGAPERSEPK